MPRISSFSASSPSRLTVTIVRAGPRPRDAARRCGRCGRSESRWWESAGSRAATSRSAIASKISSMSGRRKISPPVRSTQLTCGFSRTSATHLVGRQLVGRLALPDVARLALVLAPVGEAEIQLEGRAAAGGRPSRSSATPSCAVARNHFGLASYRHPIDEPRHSGMPVRETTIVTMYVESLRRAAALHLDEPASSRT